MKLVLLSGGSGKRLWPLSNDARSKQFLKVLENDDGERVSMVQRVWGQIEASGLGESSYIATSAAQIEMMRLQIGENAPLIIEPDRRDTFPAIALAVSYLYSCEGASPEDTMAILPVDPYVDKQFFEVIKHLEAVLSGSAADLALIGVTPTYPSAKYGYIVPAHNQLPGADYVKVDHFREKPAETQAALLIEQGALWNCGVFAFKLGYLLRIMGESGYPLQYEELAEQYTLLPKISFDYAVVEKAEQIVAVPYEGYWKDLGTWNTLTEEMKQPQIGRGTISPECVNTHLINETDIPVSVIGLTDMVVAVSADGILVADKSASTRIKDYIDYHQGPMFEERQWGWLRVLDDQHYEDGRCVATKRVCVKDQRNLGYRMHLYREEVWTIVKGEGEFIQNGNYMKVKAGNVLHIPMKILHSIRASGDLEMIVVQSGLSHEVNRIVEIYQTWDEITDNCMKA